MIYYTFKRLKKNPKRLNVCYVMKKNAILFKRYAGLLLIAIHFYVKIEKFAHKCIFSHMPVKIKLFLFQNVKRATYIYIFYKH